MISGQSRTIKVRGSDALTVVLALLCATALSCVHPGEMRTVSTVVGYRDADSVSVIMEMHSGDLSIEGGADSLLNCKFRFNVEGWEPYLNYAVQRGSGKLVLRQGRVSDLVLGEAHNEWDLTMGGSVPARLSVNLGSGSCAIHPAGLNLQHLQIEFGSGDCFLDLGGEWKKAMSAEITCGVGELVVALPPELTVVLRSDQVLSGLRSTEFSPLEDGGWVSAGGDPEDAVVVLQLNTGLGEVEFVRSDTLEGSPDGVGPGGLPDR